MRLIRLVINWFFFLTIPAWINLYLLYTCLAGGFKSFKRTPLAGTGWFWQ